MSTQDEEKETQQEQSFRGGNRTKLAFGPSTWSKKPVTKRELDELTAGVKSGMQDTAWKNLGGRVGEKEATRILKVSTAVPISQIRIIEIEIPRGVGW